MFTLELVQLWHQTPRQSSATVPGGARRAHPLLLRAARVRHPRRHG